MKILVDDKSCRKHGLSLPHVLILLAARFQGKIVDAVSELVRKERLHFDEETGDYSLTQHWSEVLDEVLADSTGEIKRTDDDLIRLAVRIQECFPKQKMRDKFGYETPFYYRCNRTEIKNALKRFFTNSSYKDASDDDIVDAAKRYVASFNGNYNGKMRLAKYFIWKNDVKPKGDGTGYVDQLSDLETFLENKDEEMENTDDWQMSSRN